MLSLDDGASARTRTMFEAGRRAEWEGDEPSIDLADAALLQRSLTVRVWNENTPPVADTLCGEARRVGASSR